MRLFLLVPVLALVVLASGCTESNTVDKTGTLRLDNGVVFCDQAGVCTPVYTGSDYEFMNLTGLASVNASVHIIGNITAVDSGAQCGKTQCAKERKIVITLLDALE